MLSRLGRIRIHHIPFPFERMLRANTKASPFPVFRLKRKRRASAAPFDDVKSHGYFASIQMHIIIIITFMSFGSLRRGGTDSIFHSIDSSHCEKHGFRAQRFAQQKVGIEYSIEPTSRAYYS